MFVEFVYFIKIRLKILWHTLLLYYIGVYSYITQLFTTPTNYSISNDLSGLVAIVTGGAAGIGYETTRRLAQAGATVIIGSADIDEGQAAVSHIKASGSEACGNVVWIELDLASFCSVHNFVHSFTDRYDTLHVLINNAGVMMCSRKTSDDGYDYQWQVNYLSHFLLTALLLPMLETSGSKRKPARIVNLASSTHYVATGIDFNNLSNEQYYSSHWSYCRSKLAVVAMTYHLSERLARRRVRRLQRGIAVTVTCVHPGVVSTGLYQHVNPLLRWLITRLLGRLSWGLKSAASGSDGVVYLAVGREVRGVTGRYFTCSGRPAPAPSSHVSYSRPLQRQLCRYSTNALNLPACCCCSHTAAVSAYTTG